MSRLSSFEGVRRDWTRLGERDPLWAVYVAPGRRGGSWDVEEFLELGRRDVGRAMAWLERLGVRGRFDRALDFGCGAGRLSQALAERAGEVVGVDVSAPMLEMAAELDRTAGRCRFVLNDADDLGLFADGEFDLVYTELVLQHLPAPMIDRYLGEFLRVLRPGGIAVFQCTVSPMWTVKGMIWRFVPPPLVRLGQRYVLRYPAPMRMTAYPARRVAAVVAAHGGEVVGSMVQDDRAAHWRTAHYAVRRPAR
ncbi:class I SAM-dependent methyltransferase [Actinophytocola sp.]|uniref:class I SAM-dependent methyltransferase n=1 Tax=Actinophytocola sp. TaxID=1872138 RepID=UPI002D7F415D|nr:class I SAM-dependent methyltransferase [Actinophytocola sp.]HET9139852.1 class I SAM-dependent methyltransferase [Actinophytocola sp.]